LSETPIEIHQRVQAACAADLFPQLPRIVGQIFCARGVISQDQVNHDLKGMLSPELLGGTEVAAELIYQALKGDQNILIVGDFDADGATSCALAVRALKAMGARNVTYLVPNRFEYGYGLTTEIVALAATQSPDLIITVDNGIASIEGVQAAKALGCRVLVTDHHLQGTVLPEADVIVNPTLSGDAFPSKNLAGVGVIFYVMVALRALLRKKGWFGEKNIPEPNLADYLDLVALGTVADLVQLDKNNRVLVTQGMLKIRSKCCNPGIAALLAIGNRSQRRAVTSDLGFVVGPRLNAAGRIDDMSLGIECLLANNVASANRYASQLDQLNTERKQIETVMKQEALAIMARLSLKGSISSAICLYDEGWHQGVIGIIASRIKERYHRPVLIFAKGEQGSVIKGSARSIPAIHIREVLDSIAVDAPGLMHKYGGHAMAAGLTLEESDFETFKSLFENEVGRRLPLNQLSHQIETDGPLAADELNLELAELLRNAAPWGQGFPEPLFDGTFQVLDARIVGGQHFKLRLAPLSLPLQEGAEVDAIAFNQGEGVLPSLGQHVDIVYKLDINEFRGNQNLQLVIDHLALKSTP